MNPVLVTFCRTVGALRNRVTTALVVTGFLSVSALLTAFNLERFEGQMLQVPSVWALSLSPILPVLAAFLSMGVWSDERFSGRIDLLLTTAVREHDFVVGKFFGVLAVLAATLFASLVSMVAVLFFLAPSALSGLRVMALLPACVGLLIQGALWCAVSVAASALFLRSAVAAGFAIVVLVGLPRGIWMGLRAFSEEGAPAFGEMPFDAHALDMAFGVFPVGVVAAYAVCSLVALFVATKAVFLVRIVGRRARGLRLSTMASVVLALALGALAVRVAGLMNFPLDLSQTGGVTTISARTRSVLMESAGTISVTCLLPRSDPRFRVVARLLRLLKSESDSVGGARHVIRYVDPRWDIGEAERLSRRGIRGDCLVFDNGRRTQAVSLDENFDERACASAIRRLETVLRRQNVYWTVGHGESRFDDYGVFGMSDIARDLAAGGFRNQAIDLSSAQQVPGDCALILVAGARNAFSRVELGRMDAYLREGGRLLVLLGSEEDVGLTSLLPGWGIRPHAKAFAGVKTMSGSDVIVSRFADHAIGAPLRGSRIVLDRPVAFLPSSAVEAQSGADRIAFSEVAVVGSDALVASVERGGGAGQDLAIRPTRIVAVGDPAFAQNGALATRANANRDFFLNCVSYLSGTDVVGSPGEASDLLSSGMDRRQRMRHLVVSSAVVPGVLFLVLCAVAVRRRVGL